MEEVGLSLEMVDLDMMGIGCKIFINKDNIIIVVDGGMVEEVKKWIV